MQSRIGATGNDMQPPVPLLRLPQVVRLVGLQRDSIYRLMREKKFPSQIKLTTRSSAWRSDEISDWIESRTRVGKV